MLTSLFYWILPDRFKTSTKMKANIFDDIEQDFFADPDCCCDGQRRARWTPMSDEDFVEYVNTRFSSGPSVLGIK